MKPHTGTSAGTCRSTPAITSLIAIFLPDLLVPTGTLPFWDEFRRHTSAQAIMRRINASLLGCSARRSTIPS
jgi:hypothetical protein